MNYELINIMITLINELVTVGVIFGDGRKIKPVWFKWRGKKHSIQTITYTWTSRQGRALIHHFSATDGANLYELCYNTESLDWELAHVEVNG